VDLEEIGWEGMDWIHLAQDRDWWQALVLHQFQNYIASYWRVIMQGEFSRTGMKWGQQIISREKRITNSS
jgi:hypothetical protein